MYARMASVSVGLSASANEAMPRSERMPFNTTWSNAAWEFSNGVRVRSGKFEPRVWPWSPWQAAQFFEYNSPPFLTTSADAVSGGGLSCGGVYGTTGGSTAFPFREYTSKRE